jgi:predicted Zn-ribbon and HTH transcriptional regulator
MKIVLEILIEMMRSITTSPMGAYVRPAYCSNCGMISQSSVKNNNNNKPMVVKLIRIRVFIHDDQRREEGTLLREG